MAEAEFEIVLICPTSAESLEMILCLWNQGYGADAIKIIEAKNSKAEKAFRKVFVDFLINNSK